MTNVTDQQISNLEQISNLMDSEWGTADSLETTDALVRTLQNDDAARQKWVRYHLMRDVMQNNYTPAVSATLGAGFAAKVASAIEAEPAIVAFPANQSASAGEVSPRNISSAKASSTARPAQNWRRNATGLAVAASVAMVSVVGLNLLRDSNTNDAGSQGAVAVGPANVGPANSGLQSLTAGVQQLELVANRGTHWESTSEKTLSTKNEEKLNMFLSRHIENAPIAHTGMLPYSRLVGYDKVRK